MHGSERVKLDRLTRSKTFGRSLIKQFLNPFSTAPLQDKSGICMISPHNNRLYTVYVKKRSPNSIPRRSRIRREATATDCLLRCALPCAHAANILIKLFYYFFSSASWPHNSVQGGQVYTLFYFSVFRSMSMIILKNSERVHAFQPQFYNVQTAECQ